MDGRDGLQLLPGTKKRLGIKIPGENKFLYVGSAVFGAVLVTMFALGRQEASLQGQIKQLNDQIVTLEQKRSRNDEKEIILTKDRLALISELIKNHPYWTQAFSWLESMLQREVHVESITAASDGKFVFAGTAASYTVVARQIAVFLTDSNVKDLSIGKITSLSDGAVEFGMELKLDISKIILKQ